MPSDRQQNISILRVPTEVRIVSYNLILRHCDADEYASGTSMGYMLTSDRLVHTFQASVKRQRH